MISKGRLWRSRLFYLNLRGGVVSNGFYAKIANFFYCLLSFNDRAFDYRASQMNRDAAPKKRGRKPSGNPCKKLSIAPRLSEYEAIKKAAEAAGQTFSRYVIDAAMTRTREAAAQG